MPGSGVNATPLIGDEAGANQYDESCESPAAWTSPSNIRIDSSVVPSNGIPSALRT